MNDKTERRSLDDLVLGQAGTWRRSFTSMALIALGGWSVYFVTDRAHWDQPEAEIPADPDEQPLVEHPLREEVTFALPRPLYELWQRDPRNPVYQDPVILGEFVKREGIGQGSAVVRKRLHCANGSTRSTEEPIPLSSQGHRLIGQMMEETPGRERQVRVVMVKN